MSFPSIATSRPLTRVTFSRPRAITGRVQGEEGFSLLEMAIVVALMIIAGTIALLMAQNVIRSVHLHGTATNYANLLQQARVRAVQDDTYYTVVASSSPSVCGGFASVNACAFIDIAKTGVYAANDPLLEFNSDVKPISSSSAPNTANLEAQFLPSGTTGTINTAQGPTFGPRGIPCKPTLLGSCPYTTPTSYMTFMKNVRSLNYEAITVTPAGRIRLWSYGSSGTWSPMN